MMSYKYINQKPKISVLLPVYNCEEFLKQSMDSLLSQTFKDFEIIAIDDRSTDKSYSILKKYEKADSRVKIFQNEKNQGLIFTLNKAVTLTQADILARMDADDITTPDRFELQYEFLINHPEYILVGGHVDLIDEKGKYMYSKKFPIDHRSIKNMLYIACRVQHPTIMINRSKLSQEFSWYTDEMGSAADVDLFFKLLQWGQFANINKVVNSYRQHGDSISYENTKLTFKLTYLARKTAVQKYGYTPTIKALLINELQRLIIQFIPNKYVYPIFYKLRNILLFISKDNSQSKQQLSERLIFEAKNNAN